MQAGYLTEMMQAHTLADYADLLAPLEGRFL